MSLYNVNFFGKDLGLSHHALADFDYIESDYLAPENKTIEIEKTTDVHEQDLVFITELPEYLGIVNSVTQTDYTTKVMVKPFVTVLEQPVIFDTSLQAGCIELRTGLNRLYYGEKGSSNEVTFRIYLKPNEYKFGLFNANGKDGKSFKKINEINMVHEEEGDDHGKDAVQFICKCGHSMFDESKGEIYGPRVCVNGAVNQPNVEDGTYLYYKIDNSGKSFYGKWSKSMIEGDHGTGDKKISGDEWLRQNVQLLCSPSIIYVEESTKEYYAYSKYTTSDKIEKVNAYWSFFGKDRHGRYFLGTCGKMKTAPQIWDILFKSCEITELAFVGGGKVENNIATPSFKDMPDTGQLMGWEGTEFKEYRMRNVNVGDTFAFYKSIGSSEEDKKQPNIRDNSSYEGRLDPNKTLEDTVADLIRTNWINCSDSYLKMPMFCTTTSRTNNWTLSIKPDAQAKDGTYFPQTITNFYSTILKQIFKIYRISVMAKMNWNADEKIELTIGVPGTGMYIDCADPSVKIKELIDGEIQDSTNKLVVYDADGFQRSITFYRYKTTTAKSYRGDAVSYGTGNIDRIYPVVQKIVAVDTSAEDEEQSDGSKKTFDLLAWEQAKSEFADMKWKNYIELEVYNPPEIKLGQLCIIYHNGKAYETVLSGFKSGNPKTLMFGAIREDYTKTMIINDSANKSQIKMAGKDAYSVSSTVNRSR